jgi:arylformamidase
MPLCIEGRHMLYRGMDRKQLDAAYNNRAAVPEHAAIYDDWAARSAAIRRQNVSHLDRAYGDGPRQRLDLFLAKKATPILP